MVTKRGVTRRGDAPRQPAGDAGAGADVGVDEIGAVLDACRSLVAISALSVETVADEVDLLELRILVVLAVRGVSSLKDLADAVGLHLTRASRACERLVGRNLITRSDDPDDRRVLQLRLSKKGQSVVHRVMNARRAAIAPVLAAMSVTRRAELVRALRAFAAASGDVGHGEVSSLAWTQ